MKLKPSPLHKHTPSSLLNPFLYSTLADGLLSFKCRILLAQLPTIHPSPRPPTGPAIPTHLTTHSPPSHIATKKAGSETRPGGWFLGRNQHSTATDADG